MFGCLIFEIIIQLLFGVEIYRQKYIFECLIEFKLYLKSYLCESCMRLFFHGKVW
jgi:hypothetical protein